MLAAGSRPVQEIQHPTSILIVRTSAIGDVLMASPVAQALREAYPDAHIAWAVEPLSAPLVRANPFVDEIITINMFQRWPQLWRQRRFITLWREMRDLAHDLHGRKFDLVIDVHGLLKSGVVSGFTHAPRRIGPAPSREANRLFVTELTPWNTQPTHLADKYLSLLAPLGIDTTPRRPVLVVPEEDRVAARNFLTAQGLVYERYVACCIASSRPQKDWIASRWGELADLFWERDGLRTVLIGGPERQQEAMQIVSGCPTSRPISAIGQTSLLESAALVQEAVGVIGVDTGLTYAGMAVDIPTIALYGSTDAEWLCEEPFTTVIKHHMPCSPCNRHPRCRDFDCMRAITPEEIADALRKQIEQVTYI